MDEFLAEPFAVESRGDVYIVRARPAKLGPMEAEALVDVVFGDESEAHEHIVIDLTGVSYMNSATMSVLWRVSQARELRLVGVSPDVERLLVTMGIMHLLDCDSTLEAALAAFTRP